MKKYIFSEKRRLAPVLLSLLGFLILTCLLFAYRRDQSLFEDAAGDLFRQEMLSNTLNMHYTLAHPENYGIRSYTPVLPCYRSGARLAGQAQLENSISFFRTLDGSRLPKEEAYARDLLVSSLELSLKKSAYPYYEEPLSPASGMQSQLPILLAEYAFRSRQDVEDYLKLLDQTDEYFDSLAAFEQEKARAGLLMAAPSLEKVLEQCETVVTRQALEKGDHFLQTTFRERTADLCQKGLITKKEAAAYIYENERLLSTVLLPAYEALYDRLFVLEDPSIPLSGLAAKRGGQDYYQCLLASETGSSRPVEEIRSLLASRFTLEYQALDTLLASGELDLSQQAQQEYLAAFPYTEASQMLADLQRRMEKDFPALISREESLPVPTVKTVSPSLQEYCAPAFYLTPPLDDGDSNVIYLNEKNPLSGLELYTTLAHEGYPGHMYQSLYSNQHLQGEAVGPLRQLLWYGGYLEGWALYVEFLSYDYACDLMEEQGQKQAARYIQFQKHSRSLQLCLYSLLDLMIHNDGASQEKVCRALENFGITDPDAAGAVYAYIVEEPANYLKYYLGYLEILELQKKARSLWGEGYSDLDFHTFYLDMGPADFDTLGKALEQYSQPAGGD